MSKVVRIAVDFDGTLVDHRYPEIGPEADHAFTWLRRLQEAGAMLLLWTMRSDGGSDGPVLTQAVEFCESRGITFDGVNEGPGDRSWTTSPKMYAHYYVDDAAFGCPTIERSWAHRPFVNWAIVGPALLRIVEKAMERTGIQNAPTVADNIDAAAADA